MTEPEITQDQQAVASPDEDAPAAWQAQQAAKRLSIPYRTVMRLIHNGQLRAIRAGRYYLVPEEAIKEFLGTAQVAS
jgi:excisionase family DNA binding protein